MVDFGTILKRGKRRHVIKNEKGHWGRCESCDERRMLFPYKDGDNKEWQFCEECTDTYIKEESE